MNKQSGGLWLAAADVVTRKPLLASISAGLVAAAGAVGAYSYLVEPYWLEVTRPSITLPRLPEEFDGFVIGQLSDFHLLARSVAGEAVFRAIEECNRAKPDVVVLTGDYVASRRALNQLPEVLKQLTIRPALAVFGNHDYRFGRDHRRLMVRAFQDAGITLVDNAAFAVSRGSRHLWFVGVGDGHTSHDRFDDAVRGLCAADRPRILLTHYPDLLLDLPPDQVDLALAGHTHGAQVRLPFLTQWVLRGSDSRFSSGFFEVCGVPMYVNRGLGCSSHQIRFRSRPELTLLTLRSPLASG